MTIFVQKFVDIAPVLFELIANVTVVGFLRHSVETKQCTSMKALGDRCSINVVPGTQ